MTQTALMSKDNQISTLEDDLLLCGDKIEDLNNHIKKIMREKNMQRERLDEYRAGVVEKEEDIKALQSKIFELNV